MISWMISAFCMVALAVILLAARNRPVQGTGITLTLNAIIAILANVAKAALLLPTAEALGQLKWMWFARANKLSDFETYEYAIRGPWGSLLLLWNLKGR